MQRADFFGVDMVKEFALQKLKYLAKFFIKNKIYREKIDFYEAKIEIKKQIILSLIIKLNSTENS